ncbi:MAG: hypothetical protein EZS28_025882 [Streblomastix strix]|uniref:Uncharacterized protein n=1 Tax=Streblomastix strix TaxID=222440 RepID=A0A5J4V7V1_9EUKA|nr:MAG: hypothetical protein EZS28_025882 [Streblomastix strix]
MNIPGCGARDKLFVEFDRQRMEVITQINSRNSGRFVQVNGNSVEGTFKEETKTIEVPIEKEKKEGEEGQEEEEEGKEPELLFKQLEKITMRQFYPHTFTESTPEV